MVSDGRTSPLTAWAPPSVLTARALAPGGDGALLLTLGLLPPAVTVIRVPVAGAHRSVGPVADDTVTGTAGAAPAGQAHGTEPAHIWAPVWAGKVGRSERPECHLGTGRGSMGTQAGEWAPVKVQERVGTLTPSGKAGPAP